MCETQTTFGGEHYQPKGFSFLTERERDRLIDSKNDGEKEKDKII